MRISYIFIVTVIFIQACTTIDKNNELIVDFNGLYSEPLYLNFFTGSFERQDTATLATTGIYSFNMTDKPHGIYQISTNKNRTFNFVYDCDTTFKINVLPSGIEQAATTNTETMMLIQELNNLKSNLHNDIQRLYSHYNITDSKQLYSSKYDSLNIHISKLKNAYKEAVLKINDKDSNGFSTLYLFDFKNTDNNIFDILSDYDILYSRAQKLVSLHPDNPSANGFFGELTKLSTVIKNYKSLKVGNKLPKIEILTADSTVTALAIAKAKAIFIYDTENRIRLSDYYRNVVQPLFFKGYEVYDICTDIIVSDQQHRWNAGQLKKPDNYFYMLPLPMIIITDENNKITKNFTSINNLIEQLQKL